MIEELRTCDCVERLGMGGIRCGWRRENCVGVVMLMKTTACTDH